MSTNASECALIRVISGKCLCRATSLSITNQPSTKSRRTVAATLTLLLAVAVLLLPLPKEWATGWRAVLLNRMHVPLTAVLCFALASAPAHASLAAALKTALMSAFLAGLMEILQPFFGRTASWADFGWSLAGVLSGSLWYCASLQSGAWRRGLVYLLAAAMAVAPPASWWYGVKEAEWSALRHFPDLLPPKHAKADFFWFPRPPAYANVHSRLSLVRRENKAVSVRLDTLGRDWSAFAGLEISGTLHASKEVELGIRVDPCDEAETKLRMGTWLRPGQQVYRVQWPKGKEPRSTRQLVLFLPESPVDAVFKLLRVSLIP